MIPDTSIKQQTKNHHLTRKVWFSSTISIILVIGSLPMMLGVSIAFILELNGLLIHADD
jgi:hypothetical protein